MNYRREIDGLRALAVLPVILFHAGFETFSGGFVGVDVFFVISGYLITTIIHAELQQGTFSIANFYERRARRILPALFLVMLVSIPFAWHWLLPSAMKDFSQSIVTVSVFASNILFWRESGYFDTAAELKPLLHTWSLAVEEQYYILFPLFLMAFWRLGKRLIFLALALVFATSLAVAQYGAYVEPAAAFYLLPTRAWELLIGSFSAFYLSSSNQKNVGRYTRELFSCLGLALILYAVFTFDKNTPFPGLHALVPTIGTALIIVFATQQTSLGRLVGNRVFVAVGLISYSAYLWHQPLFAFARHRSMLEPSNDVLIGLALLSLVLAYFTWKFVELPFRNRLFLNRKIIFGSSLFVSVIFIAFGAFGHFSAGYKARFSEFVNRLQNPNEGFPVLCEEAEHKKPCLLGAQGQTPKVAIMGDSHSGVLRHELSKRFEEANESIVSFKGAWCAPLSGYGTMDPRKKPVCKAFMTESIRSVAEKKDIETVVLVAGWSIYTKGTKGLGKNDNGVSFYSDYQSATLSAEENIRAFERSFLRTIQLLRNAGKRIIVVKSVPEYPVSVPRIIAKNYIINGRVDLGGHEIDEAKYLDRNREAELAFAKAVGSGVYFIDTFRVFCADGICDFADEYGSYYTDGEHLSVLGSRRVVDAIVEALRHQES